MLLVDPHPRYGISDLVTQAPRTWNTCRACPVPAELGSLLLQNLLHRLLQGEPALAGVRLQLLGNLHAAETRAAHGTEVSQLSTLSRQGLVVVFPSPLGIEGKIELVHPAELKAGFGERIVTQPGHGMALGQIGGMGGDSVGDYALAYIVLVGQAQMLFGSDIASMAAPYQAIMAAPMAEVMWS